MIQKNNLTMLKRVKRDLGYCLIQYSPSTGLFGSLELWGPLKIFSQICSTNKETVTL